MTEADWSFILAFVITPAVVVLLGYVAVLLHERADGRARRDEPAE